jgi:hypothetical protein
LLVQRGILFKDAAPGPGIAALSSRVRQAIEAVGFSEPVADDAAEGMGLVGMVLGPVKGAAPVGGGIHVPRCRQIAGAQARSRAT